MIEEKGVEDNSDKAHVTFDLFHRFYQIQGGKEDRNTTRQVFLLSVKP